MSFMLIIVDTVSGILDVTQQSQGVILLYVGGHTVVFHLLIVRLLHFVDRFRFYLGGIMYRRAYQALWY